MQYERAADIQMISYISSDEVKQYITYIYLFSLFDELSTTVGVNICRIFVLKDKLIEL